MRRPLPWGEYASRGFASLLLFATGFALLAQSTFAVRMRNDMPISPDAIALAMAAILAIIPLVAGGAYLGTFLVCGWLLSGIGAYWWTTIPWDALINDSLFPAGDPAGFWDYVLAAGPGMVATLYVVLSRTSQLRHDAKARGIDADEARRAAAAAFLAGAGTIVGSFGLALGFCFLLASGALLQAPSILVGPLPIAIAAVLVSAAWAIAAARRSQRVPPRPDDVGAQETPAPPSGAGKAPS